MYDDSPSVNMPARYWSANQSPRRGENLRQAKAEDDRQQNGERGERVHSEEIPEDENDAEYAGHETDDQHRNRDRTLW
jgi:hypothetical protein